MASKTTKRPYGEGSVFPRGNKYWIKYRVNGKPISESSGSSDEEVALQLLKERLVEIGRGNGKQFLGWRFDLTAREWLAHVSAPGTLEETTIEKAEGIINGHLIPVWGEDFLHQMDKPIMFERYAIAKLSGKSLATGEPLPVEGNASQKPLSPQSVHHHLNVLSQIFDWAVKDGRLSINPVRLADRPSIDRNKPEPFERDEVRDIMEQMAKDEDKFFVLTLASLGLRLGEALGLKVTDFKKKKGILEIRRTVKRGPKGSFYLARLPKKKHGTKTPASERDLVLSPFYIQLLEEHIERMRAADRLSPDGDQMIFPNTVGTLKHPGNWRNKVWNKAVEGAGLYDPETDHKEDRPTPHRLRHTYASEQIAENIPISVISYRLGHADANVTLRVYAHIFKRHGQDIADSAEIYSAASADAVEELAAA